VDGQGNVERVSEAALTLGPVLDVSRGGDTAAEAVPPCEISLTAGLWRARTGALLTVNVRGVVKAA
jgi:hypothetical protein